MVTITIARMQYSQCSVEYFKINGNDADIDDFGDMEDTEPSGERYVCGCMKFIPKMPTKIILEKYGIDVDEYAEVCDEIESVMYVGRCGMCV